jgi:S-adenosylmethionine:tRNA ribosyltransferase-isomerase
VRTSDFDYDLPERLIAQHPAPQRDQSRLLVLERASGKLAHERFAHLPQFLRAGDVLVLNNSKVIPARLHGMNARTRGEFEMLLVSQNATNDWWAMMRPGKRARPNTEIQVRNRDGSLSEISATVIGINEEGHRRLRFSGSPDIMAHLPKLGEIPLPPYIRRANPDHEPEDFDRYQTVYAQTAGSVAAPTAGLHFTPEMLKRVTDAGVSVCYVTLHVGLGTFAPVKAEQIEEHVMHRESYDLPSETVHTLASAKPSGRRIIAVGTTTLRVLESAGATNDLRPGAGSTNIFIYPPRQFRWVDALLTNFHLPRSTLLMLVSAFASPGEMKGRELILAAYREAIREEYRFFSYGDAMLIL